VDVGRHAALVYTECARIWNPIHTDLAVARAAGLVAPILHGTATLALAVSRVVTRDLQGQPLAVAEVSARFTAMVPMPATLRVRAGDRVDDHIGFDVVNEAGAPVLTAGRIRFASPPPASATEP
jgi:MaoC like domain